MLSQIYIPEGIKDWKETLLLFPETCQDIYFTPEYLKLHSRDDSSRAICLKYQEGDQTWIFPGLLNTIQKIGNISLPSGLFDFETAYGYGGPLSNSEDRGFLKKANQAFIDWAKNNGVVAQFVRFHPLLGNERWIEDGQLEILLDRFTLSTDINTYDPLHPFYSSTTRNMVERAARLSIESRLLNVEQEFPAFLELYHRTMLRLGAESYYFFDNFYFEQLRLLVKEKGLLIGAFHEGRMISAAIFFYGTCWLHYHLSASDFGNRLPGSTNIILDLAFQEAKSKGFKQVHLGGGRTTDSEDSLLKFKKSMSNSMHRFYIGKRIYNPLVYKNLVAIWRQEFPTLVDQYQARILCYRYSL